MILIKQVLLEQYFFSNNPIGRAVILFKTDVIAFIFIVIVCLMSLLTDNIRYQSQSVDTENIP